MDRNTWEKSYVNKFGLERFMALSPKQKDLYYKRDSLREATGNIPTIEQVNAYTRQQQKEEESSGFWNMLKHAGQYLLNTAEAGFEDTLEGLNWLGKTPFMALDKLGIGDYQYQPIFGEESKGRVEIL